MSNEEVPANALRAMEIIQSANGDNGWVSEEEHNRICAELSKLGVTVVASLEDDEAPATDKPDRTFFEVTIHPFVQQ